MMRKALLPFLALSLLAAACGPKMIPNTTIEDTPDHRDVLEVVRRYRQAYEAKDAAAIAEIASDRYLDRRDNISKETLTENLEKDFEKVRELQLDVNVRRVEISGDRAQVDYFYSTSFLLAANDATWQTETDDKRMILARESDGWKVVSGL